MKKNFVKAYDELSDAIFRHCYLRISDREKAKDICQEAFMKAWKYMKDGNDIQNLKAFIYKTANNLIIDEYRRKKSLSLDKLMVDGFDPASKSHQDISNFAMANEIIKFIHCLDERYRAILIMKYVDDLTYKEIAKITGLTENYVLVRLNRGVKKIKLIMQKPL